MRLPKLFLGCLWIHVVLGALEVLVVVVGSVLTRSFQLLPMVVVGLGDLGVSALLLWAFTRARE